MVPVILALPDDLVVALRVETELFLVDELRTVGEAFLVVDELLTVGAVFLELVELLRTVDLPELLRVLVVTVGRVLVLELACVSIVLEVELLPEALTLLPLSSLVLPEDAEREPMILSPEFLSLLLIVLPLFIADEPAVVLTGFLPYPDLLGS